MSIDSKEYFAPGIPREHFEKKIITKIPEDLTGKRLIFGVQKHDAIRAGTHYDLRLGDPETGKAYSWAIPATRLPMPHEKPVLAIPTYIHDIHYMPFEGYIKEKYGRGKVRVAYYGEARVKEAKPHRIEFEAEIENKRTGEKERRKFLLVSHNMKGEGTYYLFGRE